MSEPESSGLCRGMARASWPRALAGGAYHCSASQSVLAWSAHRPIMVPRNSSVGMASRVCGGASGDSSSHSPVQRQQFDSPWLWLTMSATSAFVVGMFEPWDQPNSTVFGHVSDVWGRWVLVYAGGAGVRESGALPSTLCSAKSDRGPFGVVPDKSERCQSDPRGALAPLPHCGLCSFPGVA